MTKIDENRIDEMEEYNKKARYFIGLHETAVEKCNRGEEYEIDDILSPGELGEYRMKISANCSEISRLRRGYE